MLIAGNNRQLQILTSSAASTIMYSVSANRLLVNNCLLGCNVKVRPTCTLIRIFLNASSITQQ